MLAGARSADASKGISDYFSLFRTFSKSEEVIQAVILSTELELATGSDKDILVIITRISRKRENWRPSWKKKTLDN